MLGRIIEIEGEGRRLSLERGFLAVHGPEGRLGEAPLDDIEALIISNPAASVTTQLVSALMQRGTPIVMSGANFKPTAYVLPVDGHHAQGLRFEAQANVSLPTRKRLWAEIVVAKIKAQAAALDSIGVTSIPIAALADKVRSGDPDNMEALAAQRYFPAMFGKGFFRHRDGDGINALLNYGYTVLRAATARAIIGAGLHPSLALHHRSRGDAFRLADDLMEPFRPAIDLLALALVREGAADLETSVKRRLAGILHADYQTEDGATILSNVLVRLCQSLAQVYLGERKTILLPRQPLPLSAEIADEGNE
jgi:CRISP-associated protein Cas1